MAEKHWSARLARLDHKDGMRSWPLLGYQHSEALLSVHSCFRISTPIISIILLKFHVVTLSHAIFSACDLQGFETAVVSNLEALASALWSWQWSDILFPYVCEWQDFKQIYDSVEAEKAAWSCDSYFDEYLISDICMFQTFQLPFWKPQWHKKHKKKHKNLWCFLERMCEPESLEGTSSRSLGRRSRSFRTLDTACTDNSLFAQCKHRICQKGSLDSWKGCTAQCWRCFCAMSFLLRLSPLQRLCMAGLLLES